MGEQVAVALVGVAVLALERVVRVVAVVAAGDRLPLVGGVPVRVLSVVGGVVVPVMLALSGQPPLGWHERVPRDPGPVPRHVDLAIGVAGCAVVGLVVLALPALPALRPLLALTLLPLPGQAGGRLLGAALPAGSRPTWRRWERRLPAAVAPALLLALLLAVDAVRPTPGATMLLLVVP